MIRALIARLYDIPGNDPEDTRKRRLLAIMMLGICGLGIFLIILLVIMNAVDPTEEIHALNMLYLSLLAVLVSTVILYVLNRSVSGSLARALFMVMWAAVLPFTDVPYEVIGGRSLFTFVIPIIISSVLLRPSSSFVFAFTGGLTVVGMGYIHQVTPNVPAISGFFLIALVSWLSARSLEEARNALIGLNRELDKRVTERTGQLTEALNRERAEAGRNQAILEGITDGVVVFDNQGRAMLANPALQMLTGIPVQSIIGRQLPGLLAESDLAEKDRKTLQVFIQRPVTSSDHIQVQWGNKTLVISVAPVVTASGELIGRVAVFHNYTHQAEVDQMKSDFVAMVSHELRTPLNSILGYADMLREGVYGKLGSQQGAVVDRVTTNTRRLLVLVNDLLDQAQIDSGRIIFHYRFFRPAELTEHMHGMVDGFVEAKGLDLTVRIADDLPRHLFGDPQRLGQVLVNLVNNAVKFTQKGMIAVRIYRLDAEHWAMEVSDTGIGIPPEDQKYIFDIFRQANMNATRQHGGIGLGLTIVKRLVTMMDGELCVNSQVGKGSTFTVILPFEPSSEAGPVQANDLISAARLNETAFRTNTEVANDA